MSLFATVLKIPACAFAAALLVPCATQAQVANPIPYKLNPGSTYQTGCFPPCECPLSKEFELTGTFTLTCARDWGGGLKLLKDFAIRDVQWTVSLPASSDLPVSVVGFGTYKLMDVGPTRFDPARLDLVIGDGSVRRLKTPFPSLPGGFGFPDISITLTSTEMSCQDTVIVLDASPAGACCPNGPDDPACLIATETECASQGRNVSGRR